MTIDEAMELFSEADDEMGYEHRGYPACIGHLNGVVAVADDTGENGSSLEMYDAEEFIEWMREAKQGFDEGEFEDISEAVNLTRVDPKVSDGH